MIDKDNSEITRLLSMASAGDRNAEDKVLCLLYHDLRRILGNHPKPANDNHLKTGQR